MHPMEAFRTDLVEGAFGSWEEVAAEAWLLGLSSLRSNHPEEGSVLVLMGDEEVLAILDLHGKPIYLAPLERWLAQPLPLED